MRSNFVRELCTSDFRTRHGGQDMLNTLHEVGEATKSEGLVVFLDYVGHDFSTGNFSTQFIWRFGYGFCTSWTH